MRHRSPDTSHHPSADAVTALQDLHASKALQREQLLTARAELESHRLAVARVRAHCRAAGPLTSRLAGRVLDLLGDLP